MHIIRCQETADRTGRGVRADICGAGVNIYSNFRKSLENSRAGKRRMGDGKGQMQESNCIRYTFAGVQGKRNRQKRENCVYFRRKQNAVYVRLLRSCFLEKVNNRQWISELHFVDSDDEIRQIWALQGVFAGGKPVLCVMDICLCAKVTKIAVILTDYSYS